MKRATLLLIALAAWSAPARSSAESVYAIDREQVNVRGDATTRAQRVGVLRRGEQVVELRRHDQWLEVRLPEGGTGWIHAQLLQQRYVVEGQGVRLREGPSTDDTSVTMLFRGQEVGRLGQRGNWTNVRTDDGRTGWLSSRYLRAKEAADLAAERPAPAVAAPVVDAEPEPPPEPVVVAAATEEPDADEFAILRRNPYAEGLQHEASGDYDAALARFEEVIAAEPEHVNALVHAAQAHRHLGGYGEALVKLYRALETSGGRKDIYLTLGEVYRLRAEPDSAAKYQALFRGQSLPSEVALVPGVESVAPIVEDPRPIPTREPAATAPATSWLGAPWLVIGMAGVGLLALAAVVWWVVGTSSSGRRGPAAAPGGRFAKVWQGEEEAASQGKATPEEEQELDHQIDAKWRELKASEEAFRAAPASAAEGDNVDRVLDQVEGLRRSLEGQDERAQIYADIVRLQNMKIDAMAEEVRRLRSRGRA